MAGCNPNHISNVENAKTGISLDALLSIADVLDFSTDYLLGARVREKSQDLDMKIMNELRLFPDEKKEKVLELLRVL